MAGSIQRNNIHAKEILLTVAKTGIIIVATTSPFFLSAFIKEYFKHLSQKQKQARRRVLYELERRKYLSFDENKDGTMTIKLTHQGKLVVRRYNLEEMQIRKPKKWD
ncbi:MAG: hypothetical protein UW92_C0017G0015, partial [Candidatus Jorgensenbacteria bacterium GW2011_GWA2_45_13]